MVLPFTASLVRFQVTDALLNDAIAMPSSNPAGESDAHLVAGVGGGGASQYGKTPIRDELGLNDPDNLAIGSSKQAERARQARMNSELRSGLANLPKPQNEYEIRVPEADDEADEQMAEPMEEDAADVAARKRAVQKAKEEAELRKRSQVCCLLCQMLQQCHVLFAPLQCQRYFR